MQDTGQVSCLLSSKKGVDFPLFLCSYSLIPTLQWRLRNGMSAKTIKITPSPKSIKAQTWLIIGQIEAKLEYFVTKV